MAEIVVGPVIDKLIRLLLEEAKLLKGVHGEVQSLTDELESIKYFLKDAESRVEKGETNGGLKIWVKQVTDEANRIEDVIDEYLHRVTPRHGHHQSRFSGFPQKIGLLIKQWKGCRDLPSKVEDIKTLLSEIKQRSERYDFRKYSAEEGSDNKITVHVENGDFIGKTTHASKVYNSEIVKKHFNCCSWIVVSQSYNMQKLLNSMIRQICISAEGNKGEMDGIEELIDFLRHFLEQQSRVIVTTRSDTIATAALSRSVM
ncbi:hypothetical protein TIFTF001_046100 [Ficus carica]|uniref:Rx N-terminal domain-containing protein n=1 Tax=Ficus carica TaxID=3494 RepID=A0AA88CRA7_FICCA|nr:hypothetical protein TIFTF001_046100 [Ficus carica]